MRIDIPGIILDSRWIAEQIDHLSSTGRPW
jgi:hypothetical protein